MDEPLSNLDAKLRVQMRGEIHDLQRRLGVTTIYVTHDQIEALTLGDRVAVMLNGRLQQVATPEGLYERPRNEFVASFIGSPSINMVEAELARSNGGLAVSFGGHTLAVDEALARSHRARRLRRADRSCSGSGRRTSRTSGSSPDAPADRRIRTVCVLSESLGAEVLVYFEVEATGVLPVELDAEADRRRRGARAADAAEDARHVEVRGPREPARAVGRGKSRRARGRHEPSVLLRPRDRAGDLRL